MRNLFLALVALAVFGAAGSAQVTLNEFHVNDAGADDFEFIELVGVPATSLDFIVICAVEADASSTIGTLDDVYDLTGNTIPADGFWVTGMVGVPNIDVDISLFGQGDIENGAQTWYLIDAVDAAGVAAIQALQGTDISTSATTTMLPSLGTILDSVAAIGGGNTIGGIPTPDSVWDGAPTIGPDGTFDPGGFARTCDFPTAFDLITEFDPPAGDVTPGEANFCPMPGFPGNGGPATLDITINSSLSTSPVNEHVLTAGVDSLGFSVFSDGNMLPGRGLTLATEVVVGGPAAFAPAAAILPSPAMPTSGTAQLDLWLNPAAIIVIADGTTTPVPVFAPALPADGSPWSYGDTFIPPSFAGFTAAFQCLVNSQGVYGAFGLTMTDVQVVSFM